MGSIPLHVAAATAGKEHSVIVNSRSNILPRVNPLTQGEAGEEV